MALRRILGLCESRGFYAVEKSNLSPPERPLGVNNLPDEYIRLP